MELHAKYPLMDGHNDLPWAIKCGFDNDMSALPDLSTNLKGVKFDGIRHGCLHTDIPRLKIGGAGAQFWSVYIPTSITGPEAIQATMEQIDVVHRLCEQ
jgi:membrane dipeptidase